ncbi:MAG: hypothetical protein WA966_10960 [Ornithinimicrobium sp.]
MTEQQPYDVARQFDASELRRYPEHLVANIHGQGTFDSADPSTTAQRFRVSDA